MQPQKQGTFWNTGYPPGIRQAPQKPEPGKKDCGSPYTCEMKASENAALDGFQPAFTAQTLWPMVAWISSTVWEDPHHPLPQVLAWWMQWRTKVLLLYPLPSLSCLGNTHRGNRNTTGMFEVWKTKATRKQVSSSGLQSNPYSFSGQRKMPYS